MKNLMMIVTVAAFTVGMAQTAMAEGPMCHIEIKVVCEPPLPF